MMEKPQIHSGNEPIPNKSELCAVDLDDRTGDTNIYKRGKCTNHAEEPTLAVPF